MKSKYIQYGCGWSAAQNWRNFDASPTLRFERLPIVGKLYTKNNTRFPQDVEYGDIIRGLPIPDEFCEGVYCSHVLEHLSLDDFKIALKNTYKILKPGGIFRLVLPDLEFSMNNYMNNSSSSAANDFLNETSLGRVTRPRGVLGLLKEYMGNSQHLWMWDYKSLAKELEEVGFTEIRRAEFNDSKDSTFKDVEDKDRWDNCLGIECSKK